MEAAARHARSATKGSHTQWAGAVALCLPTIDHGYTVLTAVRRVATLAVAAVVAIVFTADPIACVDGCTDGGPASQAVPPTSCSLCVRGVALDGIALSVAPVLTIRPVHHPPATVVFPLFVHPIDHPPRPA